MDIRYSIERYRINAFDEEYYITVDGYAVNTDSSFPDTVICINGTEEHYEISRVKRPEIVSRYQLKPAALMCGFRLVVKTSVSELREISVRFSNADKTEVWKTEGEKVTKAINHSPLLYYVEHNTFDPNDNTISLVGWAVSLDHLPISLKVLDGAGQEVRNEHRFFYRRDMSDLYYSKDTKEQFGFNLSFKGERHNHYFLVVSTEKTSEMFAVFSQGVEEENQNIFKRILGFVNMNNVREVGNYFRTYGIAQTFRAISRKIRGKNFYHEWFKKHRIKEAELKKQKEHVFAYAPKISLLVPVFNTPEEYFREMVESVQKQSYANWELCLADGSQEGHIVKQLIQEYAAADPRIRYTFLDQNYGISGNTNKALELATGEYIGLFDHDDLLEPDILFDIVESLQEVRHDAIYTDEDKLNSKTKQYETPTFKPDFDITLLRSENYITHFFTVKAEILKGVGGFHSEYDGSQDLDVILRCVENAASVHHIPKILYHWRMHAASTAEDPASKLYCYQAGERAVSDHLKRVGLRGHAKFMEEPLWGTYQVTYEMDEMPFLSVVLLNCADQESLDQMLDCLNNVNDLPGYEILLCQPDTAEFTPEEDHIRMFRYHQTMRGKDLNRILSQTRGEYVLFLDNVVCKDADAIRRMLGFCVQKGTAAVGGKVLTATGEVCTSFRIVGLGEFSADAFIGLAGNDAGHLNRSVVACECSALSSVCVILKKESFAGTKGFVEDLTLDEAMIDLCLQMRTNKERIVYLPYAAWTNLGANNRQADKDSVRLLQSRWAQILTDGDPYYSPNFDSDAGPFIFK